MPVADKVKVHVSWHTNKSIEYWDRNKFTDDQLSPAAKVAYVTLDERDDKSKFRVYDKKNWELNTEINQWLLMSEGKYPFIFDYLKELIKLADKSATEMTEYYKAFFSQKFGQEFDYDKYLPKLEALYNDLKSEAKFAELMQAFVMFNKVYKNDLLIKMFLYRVSSAVDAAKYTILSLHVLMDRTRIKAQGGGYSFLKYRKDLKDLNKGLALLSREFADAERFQGSEEYADLEEAAATWS